MENLLTTPSAAHKRISDMTVGEFLTPPFPPVEVLRALGPYGRMLRLEPGICMSPDPEFLVRLLSDHASHQAYIRHKAGSNYKNLENLARGKHKPSRTTLQLLARCLNCPIEYLEKLVGSALDGPLIPDILTLFQMVEGIPMRVSSGALNRVVPCPCCGGNILDDVDAWWSKQVPAMRPSEYHFAERLLNAVLGASLIERLMALFKEQAELSLGRLETLANPLRHPIGNWLLEAQTSMSCSSLAELVAAMQMRGGLGATFSHGRLKKWSAGQDIMPFDAGEAIAEACGQAKSGIKRLMAARSIALATDFVAASWPTTVHAVSREEAQKVVHARLVQLGTNLRIAIAAMAGQTPPLTRLSANTASS